MATNRRCAERFLWIAVALLGGATMAGCGGSTGSPATSATNPSSGASQGLEFSQCMRANGVPNFPDPGPGGYTRSGIDLQSPAAKSAMHACMHYLPRSGPSPPEPASVHRQEVALAQCMRAHGVPNFPDPNANGDIQFPLSSPIPRSPAFKRAQSACAKYLDDG